MGGRRPPAEGNAVQDLPQEFVSAAHAVLEDLRRCGTALGGAYERALVGVVEGGELPPSPVLIAAIEAGRQAVARYEPSHRTNRREQAASVEIHTLCRFTAADREFEPNQRYRLTGAELNDVVQRAALEPTRTLYTRRSGR